MDASPTPPSLPFHIARAYAPSTPVRPAPAAPITTASGVTVRPSGDSVQLSGHRPQPLQQNVARLAAAKVQQTPDFVAPAPTPGTLPMYRHPADKNAAATGVQVGRVIDFSA
ncbi:MAG TPA: hypothetical protein VD997_06880 [Phycisphaerales bacterium]|nr:hypothetical protein [Phycisphaerales bacterium]